MIRVFITDDHSLFVDGVKAILESDPGIRVVGTASNGDQLLTHFRNGIEADVVTLDLNMPQTDLLQTLMTLKSENPHLKVLVISMFRDGAQINQLIRNGISGYLVKDMRQSDLIEAVKTVATGARYLSSEVTNLLVQAIQEENKAPEQEGIILTPRETDVLRLIVEGKSSQEIGEMLSISKGTVDTHAKNLKTKIGVRKNTELVRFALENGLMGTPE